MSEESESSQTSQGSSELRSELRQRKTRRGKSDGSVEKPLLEPPPLPSREEMQKEAYLDSGCKDGVARALADLIGLKMVEDFRPMAIVAFTLSILAYRFLTYTPAESKWITYSLMLFTTVFCWFCATIVHNTIHFPIFKGNQMGGKNSLWFMILCCTYGYPVTTLIPGHNLSHHKYTQGAKDVIRTTKMRWSYNLFNMLTFILTVSPKIIEQDNAFIDHCRRKGKPIWDQILQEVVWVIFTQGVLIAYDWKTWVVIIFIPQLFAKIGIISINLLQHDGCPMPEDDEYNFSRNFVDDTLNFFTCNNGYHTIHHHYPGIHWSQYKRLHEEKIKPYMHPGCDVDSIIWYLIKTFILPGGRLTYDGQPFHIGTPLFDALDVEDEPWFTAKFLDSGLINLDDRN